MTIAGVVSAVGIRRQPRAAAVFAGLVLLLLVAGMSPGALRTAQELPSAIAVEQPFREVLLETGTVGAARMMVYGSTLSSGSTKIIELVPEGTAVRPGDLLVRFDSGGFEQARSREMAALQQAGADLQRAREDLRLELLERDAHVDGARQQIARAETDLASEERGRGEVALMEARSAATEATAEAARARAAVDDLRPLLAAGFMTRAELDRAEQAQRRADDLRALADARLAALVKYERPAAINRSRAALATARDGLGRESQAADARVAQQRAAVAIAEGRVSEIAARVRALEEQIAKTSVRADAPGLVVYRDLFFGSDRRKPQVGDEVWPNQPVIALPDSGSLIIETRVRESDLHRVTSSQRVWVGIDAYPGLRLAATVGLVGSLAAEDPSTAGAKFFPVTVRLAQGDARLRPGMTARVEIEVASLARAVVVPIEAVFGDATLRYCAALENGRVVRRPVTIAAENASSAAIASGLAAGARVLLVDPWRTQAARQ
jgi:HlyD family secretion protein